MAQQYSTGAPAKIFTPGLPGPCQKSVIDGGIPPPRPKYLPPAKIPAFAGDFINNFKKYAI